MQKQLMSRTQLASSVSAIHQNQAVHPQSYTTCEHRQDLSWLLFITRLSSFPKFSVEMEQNVEERCWTRSKDINVDWLHAFESGEMSDCSFKIGAEPNCKVFKCHKLILSVASSVFQAMLHGHFKEASMDPEDPIIIGDTDPQHFETTMRYLYGKDEDIFKDIPCAIGVLKFAHKMQITSLQDTVEEFFIKNVDPTNVLAIYDAYKSIETGMNDILQIVLLMDSSAALESESLLDLPEETLVAVLQMDELSGDESGIFQALLRWGENQLALEEADSNDQCLLRAKVAPFLKYIRFESMESAKAAELCEVANIFSLEEQRSLLLAAILKDPEHLPQALAVLNSRPVRKATVDVHFSYDDHWRSGEFLATHVKELKRLFFPITVTREVQLVRIVLDHKFHKCPPKSLTLGTFCAGKKFQRLAPEFHSFDRVTYTVKGDKEAILYGGIDYKLTLLLPCDGFIAKLNSPTALVKNSIIKYISGASLIVRKLTFK